MGDTYAKGRTLFDTKDLFSALMAFGKAFGPDSAEKVHAVVSYPCNTDKYKTPCTLVEKKDCFAISENWQESYLTLGEVAGKIKNIKSAQFLLGIFDLNIAAVNINSLYDYETKNFLDVTDFQIREKVRDGLILAMQKLSSNFIIEDSVKGFHVFFQCLPNEYYAPSYRYILLGDKYVCKYNILSCKPIINLTKQGRAQTSLFGRCTLLGYGRFIKDYKICFIGESSNLSFLPDVFSCRNNDFLAFEERIEFLEKQKMLKENDCREMVKAEIFYEWFLNEPHTIFRDRAIEKMVSHYIVTVKNRVPDPIEEDIFLLDEKGEIEIVKLDPDIDPVKAEAVRRATINSVYQFYDYLNSLDTGLKFNEEQVLQEFYSFCMDRGLEPRGLWNYTNGKLLFANRFYKVLLNLAKKDISTRLKMSKDNFEIVDNEQEDYF